MALHPATPQITHQTVEGAVKSVEQHGLTVLKGAFDSSTVEALLEASKEIEKKVVKKLNDRGIPYLPSHSCSSYVETQFDEVAVRSPARIDIRRIPDRFIDFLSSSSLNSLVTGRFEAMEVLNDETPALNLIYY